MPFPQITINAIELNFFDSQLPTFGSQRAETYHRGAICDSFPRLRATNNGPLTTDHRDFDFPLVVLPRVIGPPRTRSAPGACNRYHMSTHMTGINPDRMTGLHFDA